MINLLPEKNKEEIAQEENWKLIMILGILFLIFLICFSLILYSVNIFISGEVETQKILFEQREREFQNPQMQTLQKNLILFNETLFELDSFYQTQPSPTEVLERISEALPAGVYLKNLSLVPGIKDKQLLDCSLSGFSPTRASLLELKSNLEEEEDFEEIFFPQTNWVEKENINFAASFKIK